MNFTKLPQSLLAWYDDHKRELPWRQAQPNPYHVLVSEVMLQQTTVATVQPYFSAFVERWPTLEAFAQADLQEVLHAWQGLGYYSRARNLLACAQAILRERGGIFPQTEEDLRTLPGIGPYTAAALAAIVFGEPAAVVDGNIVRVITRLQGMRSPLPQVREQVRQVVEKLTPLDRPGDFAQAMMDLGATICRPKTPSCFICPWQESCVAFQQGIQSDLPVRALKPQRPHKSAFVYWIESSDQCVWVRQRPRTGLLGSLWEFPSSPWEEAPLTQDEARQSYPGIQDWRVLSQKVIHIFTHLRLELTVLVGRTEEAELGQGHFHPISHLSELAFPTLMKRVMQVVSSCEEAKELGF